MPKSTPLADRFWAKVKKSKKCWLWAGSTRGVSKKYGAVGGGPGLGMVSAHRVSYELHYGPIPKGMCVCHKCDTPLCVNPKHLFLGTHSDNMRDKAQKGRAPALRGEANPFARLTNEQALEIFALKGTATSLVVAARYNLHSSTIRYIWAGKRYGHVTRRQYEFNTYGRGTEA